MCPPPLTLTKSVADKKRSAHHHKQIAEQRTRACARHRCSKSLCKPPNTANKISGSHHRQYICSEDVLGTVYIYCIIDVTLPTAVTDGGGGEMERLEIYRQREQERYHWWCPPPHYGFKNPPPPPPIDHLTRPFAEGGGDILQTDFSSNNWGSKYPNRGCKTEKALKKISLKVPDLTPHPPGYPPLRA